MFRKLISLLTLVALTFAGLVATPSAASAAGGTDATLSSLVVQVSTDNGWVRPEGATLAPSFDTAKTFYQGFSLSTDLEFFVQPTDPAATVKITGGYATNETVTPGTGHLVVFEYKASNPVTITVTAGDGTTTKTYRVNMSIGSIPRPEIVSLAPATFSTAGGDTAVAYVKNVLRGPKCSASIDLEYDYKDENGNLDRDSNSISDEWGETDDNGITRVLLQNYYGTYYSFRDASIKADLRISNRCFNIANGVTVQWERQRQYTLVPQAITMFNPTVTKVTVPDTVSQYTTFKVYGPGMNSEGYLEAFLENPKTGERLYSRLRWISANSFMGILDGSNNAEWLVNQDVRLVVEQYNYDDESEVEVLFTKNLKFTPRAPSRVTLSPSKGSVLGGNTVKLSGHFLCNPWLGEFAPTIKIGGKPVTDLEFQGCGSETSSSGDQYDGLDRFTFKAPANAKIGAQDVTIDNGYGTVTISQKYTYGTKPTVSSMSPSSVANTGGSLLTINGANFGTSGTPIVTIGGEKSPYVQRLSDSKLLVMVPALSTVGAVEVNVISSSGGGALDLPASITLAAASQNPTIKAATPGSASVGGGDLVTITGTGFVAGATGVTFNGVAARVTGSTATSLIVEVPAAEAAGAVAIAVGTPTGLVSKASAFTYKANPGVTSVSPSVIKSHDTGNATKIAITGVGFGSKGTITIGSSKAVAYSATAGGTLISGVAIPTTKAGVVVVSILPSGAKVPFTTSVTVTAPSIRYVGPNPYNAQFADRNPFDDESDSATPISSPAGGDVFMIKGTGFGTAGKVKFGNLTITPSSYSDTEILFTSPAATAGKYDVTVVPNTGTLTAVSKSAIIVGFGSVTAEIKQLTSVLPNDRNEPRNTFAPASDSDDLFEIKGTGFAGSDNGAKTVVSIRERNASTWITLNATSMSDTRITFRAPRNLAVLNWYTVRVESNSGYAQQELGIWYIGNAPTPTAMVPSSGLCTKDGIAPYTPAVISATGDGVFGASGTVKLGGTTISGAAVTWTTNSVTVDLSKQSASLANPWGMKEISFTPADSSLPVQTWNFNCAVPTTVTTKLNNSTADLEIAAGAAYSSSASMNNPLPGTTYVQPAGTYLFQTAADYNSEAGVKNVRSGLPVAAGTYYVWANTGLATYDTSKYSSLTPANYVKLTITGLPITFTPKLNAGGNTIVYKGQLGDGTDGSSNDIGYTVSATKDAVTKVTWQYRNHACGVQDPNWGWNNGLPNEAAIANSWCGGDDVSVTSWDIRVASFEMVSGGVDKSIYYLPTYNAFELTITKRLVTVTAVKAEKIYDGNTSISLGELTITGGLEGETPTLEWNFANSTAFADATVGASKVITTGGPIALDWGWRNKYEISNPDLVITGTIKKADALLKMTSNPGSVVLANNTPIALNLDTVDSRNSQAIDPAAGLSTPIVVSKTPSICSLNGLTVTALAVGDCVIEATQAASTNYNASVSFKDDSTTVEQIVIKVYGAPKVLSVVADDLVVSVGEEVNPSYSMTGLIDGDAYENVEYLYYQGATLLNAPPTAVGTYKVVPKDGSLTALDESAYSNAVKYVAGKLIITPLPPTITALSPAHGPEAGGNTLVITGTNLGAVTTVKVGDLVIRKPNFVVNGDGTTISFKMPKGKGGVVITLVAGPTEVTTDYSYDPPAPVTAPLSLKLTLKLEIGAKFAGQKVTIKGGGLKANSDYTLVMNSKPVTLFKAKTDANGNFLETVKIPAKACVAPGKHSVTLSGTSPAGKKVSDTAHFVINEKCVVQATAVKASSKSWTLSGFLFGYCQPTLNSGGITSLKALAPLLKGAKTITVYGYTETDTKSAAIKRSNIILAQGRTDNVVAYLKKLGVKAVFKTVAKGGVDPVSITQQFKNRRVVIEATY